VQREQAVLCINEISHMFAVAFFNNIFQFVSYYGNLYVFFCDYEACLFKCIHRASPFRFIPYSSRTLPKSLHKRTLSSRQYAMRRLWCLFAQWYIYPTMSIMLKAIDAFTP
jgi:hypothetical protein